MNHLSGLFHLSAALCCILLVYNEKVQNFTRKQITMQQSNEVINIGQLQLRFMQTAETTNDEMVVFEFTIPSGAKVPVPHYHETVDELVCGLEGTTTSIVNGQTIEVNPGDSLFIPKGATHYHDNRTQS